MTMINDLFIGRYSISGLIIVDDYVPDEPEQLVIVMCKREFANTCSRNENLWKSVI